MTVLISGDRHWTNRASIRRELEELKQHEPDAIIIHGRCDYGGADIIADEIARELGFKVIPCPAEWTKYGKAAGPLRNQAMIDTYHPDYALLFHANIDRSKGTKDMKNRLIKEHIGYKLVTS